MKRLHKKIKWLSFIMAVGLVLSGMMLPAEAYIQKSGTVNESVSLRQNAEASSSQLMELSSGQEVKVNNELSASDGTVWYQVLVGTTIGYVPANTVTVSENGTGTTTGTGNEGTTNTGSNTVTTTQTVTKTRRVGKVSAGNAIRVRPDASTTNPQVASLNAGDTFEVLEDANGSDGYVWYRIKFVQEGIEVEGYVRSDLVTVTEETYEEQITVEEPVTVPSEPEQSTPYSITSQSNAEGTVVWYLKDNTTGTVTDIASLFETKTEASGGGVSKVVVVLLLIFFIVALAGAAFFYMKWRDAEDFIAELREKQARGRRQTTQNTRTAPVKQPNPVGKPAGQPQAANTQAKPAVSKSVKQPAANPIAKPVASKTVSQPVGSPVGKPAGQPIGQPVGQKLSQTAKAGSLTDQTINKIVGRPVGEAAEQEQLPKSSDIVKTTKKEIQNKDIAPVKSQSKGWKSKNFLTDDDDLEFDFLEMDDKK